MLIVFEEVPTITHLITISEGNLYVHLMIYIQGESKKTGISKFSNCFKSLIFEAKIHCNTITKCPEVEKKYA